MSEPVLPEIAAEVKALCDTVQDLLDGPDGHGQVDHSFQTQRVCLDIPKAWMVLAAWLAIKRHQRQFGKEAESASVFFRADDPAHITINAKRWARRYLWTTLHDAMHEHLHELATGTHPYLRVAPKRKEPDRPDLDDEIPF